MDGINLKGFTIRFIRIFTSNILPLFLVPEQILKKLRHD